MKKTVPEKYHEMLTPNYGVGCKRRIFDYEWLRSLNDPKIELSTLPMTEVKENSVVLGPGRCYPDPKNVESAVPTAQKEIPADVIIMANGFRTNYFLDQLSITGVGNKTVESHWSQFGGAEAYNCSALAGFPNFFMILGPNAATGHTSAIMACEKYAPSMNPIISCG